MPLSEDEIANFKQRLLEMKYKLSHTLEGNAQEVKNLTKLLDILNTRLIRVPILSIEQSA